MSEEKANELVKDLKKLKVIEVKEFEKYLTDKALAIYKVNDKTNKDDIGHFTKTKIGDIDIEVRYLCISCSNKTGNVEEKDIKKLADIFNKCVEGDMVEGGVLSPCCCIKLVPLRDVRRFLLFLYTYSRHTKKELNKFLKNIK